MTKNVTTKKAQTSAKRSAKLAKTAASIDNASIAKAVRGLSKRVEAMEIEQAKLLQAIGRLADISKSQDQGYKELLPLVDGLANEVRALVRLAPERPGRSGSTERSSGALSSPLSRMQDLGADGIDANARNDIGKQRGRPRRSS